MLYRTVRTGNRSECIPFANPVIKDTDITSSPMTGVPEMALSICESFPSRAL